MKASRNNGLKFTLTELKEVINNYLYLKHNTVIDVMMAVYVANKFDADPLWLLIIAPPSHSKTELLRSFGGHEKVEFISNLTPSTLVSGIIPKGKVAEPSLLLKLSNKLVVLKDFTSILSMRYENQQEIIAQLREAYDGQYSKAFGNGKKVDWEGKFGLIGACTPVYDNHHGVISAMGERFLLYRVPQEDHELMGLQAQKIVGRETEMRTVISNAVHRFIDQYNKLSVSRVATDDEIKLKIVHLATFCAYARCAVERDSRDRHVKYEPVPEGSPRLVKQFMQMGMALALVHGKEAIDDGVYEIVKKIGRDLAPAQRLKILKHLWDAGICDYNIRWQKTKDIADAINMPVNTVKLILEDLMILGVLNRQRGEAEMSPYQWQITRTATDFMQNSEVFHYEPT